MWKKNGKRDEHRETEETFEFFHALQEGCTRRGEEIELWIAKRWKDDMTSEDKQPYADFAAKDLKRYNKGMESFSTGE